ncbi:unnamed protein product, partial [Ectocarpus sp. 13 AM-2016]
MMRAMDRVDRAKALKVSEENMAFHNVLIPRRDETADAALKIATNILLSDARAISCYDPMECMQRIYCQIGPLCYPDNVEGACCTGPVPYSVDVPVGDAHVAPYEFGPAGDPPGARFFDRFQDDEAWGTYLGDVANILDIHMRASSGPSPEL